MESAPQPADVVEQLGDKLVNAMRQSVADAREDLGEYRRAFPAWVAEHSPTGLANWLNDRVWAHLEVALDDLEEVSTRTQGHLREFTVGTRFRFRVKRHNAAGQVNTLETQTAIQFYEFEPAATLPDLGELCLTTGYIWDKESREMGAAVIAVSETINKAALWVHVLPGQEDLPLHLRTPEGGPVGPTIETELGVDEQQNNAQGTDQRPGPRPS